MSSYDRQRAAAYAAGYIQRMASAIPKVSQAWLRTFLVCKNQLAGRAIGTASESCGGHNMTVSAERAGELAKLMQLCAIGERLLQPSESVEIIAALRQLQEAAKDTARLDWVESDCHLMHWTDNAERQIIRAGDGADVIGYSWRDAIDKAMSAPDRSWAKEIEDDEP